MQAASLPGLMKRSMGGWNLAFYASVVSLVGSFVSYNFIGGIIGAVIGWYILFQIRSYYK